MGSSVKAFVERARLIIVYTSLTAIGRSWGMYVSPDWKFLEKMAMTLRRNAVMRYLVDKRRMADRRARFAFGSCNANSSKLSRL